MIDKRRRRQLLAGTVITVLVVFGVLQLVPGGTRATDYTFGSQEVVEGISVDASNRNSEDAAYQQLLEADQYDDTNYSGSTESVTIGTAGGGSFPSALDTYDDTRRTYTEGDTALSDTSVTLVPTSDVSVGFDAIFPTSPTTHYDKVDEGMSHDSATTYCRAVTNGDKDVYGLGDMTSPSGSPDLDVTVYVICQDAGTGSAYFDAGVEISSTSYVGLNDQLAPNSWASYYYTWELNPATSSEWTYTAINAMNVFVDVYDAAPDVDVTSVYIVVSIDYSPSYALVATITFSSVATSSQTTGFQVLCQGYRTGDTEGIKVQAWNYTSTAWVDKVTISAGSDTDYNFNLLGWAANCERSSGNAVLLRLVDASGADATQTVVYLDVLKVRRIEQGFALEVEMTATGIPSYGDMTLRIKGYTSAEAFTVQTWNYTSSAWDSARITITVTSNTWHSYDLVEVQHISSGEAQIRFLDGTASSEDLVQDTLYLDAVFVTHVHSDPTLSQDGCNPTHVNLGGAVHFWVVVTDVDNELPSTGYPKVAIEGTPYTMTENSTGDTSTVDGKAYYFDKSNLAQGIYDFHYITKDANSGEIETTDKQVQVHVSPTLTQDGVTPAVISNGEEATFFVTYDDSDGDVPAYVRVTIDTNTYDMVKNDSEDSTPPIAYYYTKIMAGGSHTYSFTCADAYSPEVETTEKNYEVNNPPVLSSGSRLPADPVYPTTELTFTVTFTDLDDDLPTAIRWREGVIQNLSMTEVDAGDVHTDDGKLYEVQLSLSHGLHSYDFAATDGIKWTSGESSSVTIQNRDPEITDGPGADPNAYRNSAWSYDFDATDPDSDTISWEKSGPSWLSIVSGTGYLSGTTPDAVGDYGFTVWANDSYSGSDSYVFTLHVVNRAPTILSAGNTTQAYGTLMAYHAQAEDLDGDDITWELATNASWLALYGDGWVNGTADTGIFWCKLWANDSYGGSDLEEWQVTVDSPLGNQAPSFTSTPDYSVANGTYYEYDANASDDGLPEPPVLTYSLKTNASWLEIDQDTGLVNGIAIVVASYWVNVTCSDGELSCSANYTLVVTNALPVFTTTPVTVGERGIEYYYDADASDANGDALWYELWEPPEWLFVDPDTGEVGGTPSLYGDYEVELRVHDRYGYTVQEWTISVPEPEPEVPLEEEDDGSYMAWLPAIIVIGMFSSLIFAFMGGTKKRKKKGA